MRFWNADRPSWVIGVLIVIALLILIVGLSFYATNEKIARKQNTTAEEVKVAYDRESITPVVTPRWKITKISIITINDNNETNVLFFDQDDVSIVIDGTKAGTSLLRQIVERSTGRIVRYESITLYVSPDDPLAQGHALIEADA